MCQPVFRKTNRYSDVAVSSFIIVSYADYCASLNITTNHLISIIQADLSTRQHPYAPNKANQITAPVLSPSVLGALDKSAKKKALTIAIGVGVVLGIMVTLVIDGILRGRQRRRDAKTDWAAPVLDREPADNRTSVVKP